MKEINYEVYTINPTTKETGWDIKHVSVIANSKDEAKKVLKNWEIFDEIILCNFCTEIKESESSGEYKLNKTHVAKEGDLLDRDTKGDIEIYIPIVLSTVENNLSTVENNLSIEDILSTSAIIISSKSKCESIFVKPYYSSHIKYDVFNNKTTLVNSGEEILSLNEVLNKKKFITELKKEYVFKKGTICKAGFKYVVYELDALLALHKKEFYILEEARDYAIRCANEYADEKAVLQNKSISNNNSIEVYYGTCEGELADIGFQVVNVSYVYAVAIHNYINTHGRTWRTKLHTSWSNGVYASNDQSEILQRFRNSVDAGLEHIKSSMSTEEIAAVIRSKQLPF